MLDYGLAHGQDLLDQISSVQILVLDDSEILDDVCVKLVIVEAAIVLEVVWVAIDVDIVQQFVVLDLAFDTGWLFFFLHSWVHVCSL